MDRKARNHCQDVDNCGDEDHCQTGNCCQDREYCLNGNDSASNYPHSSVILRKLGLKYGIRK